MRAALLTPLLASLCVSLSAVSFDPQVVRPPKPAAPVKPPAGTTFTGCLTKSAAHPKEYELTVTSVAPGATAPASKVYRLMPVVAGVNLAEHVGHRVTITGSQTGAADAKPAGATDAKSAGTATATPQLQVRVTDIHHVAPDCK